MWELIRTAVAVMLLVRTAVALATAAQSIKEINQRNSYDAK